MYGGFGLKEQEGQMEGGGRMKKLNISVRFEVPAVSVWTWLSTKNWMESCAEVVARLGR